MYFSTRSSASKTSISKRLKNFGIILWYPCRREPPAGLYGMVFKNSLIWGFLVMYHGVPKLSKNVCTGEKIGTPGKMADQILLQLQRSLVRFPPGALIFCLFWNCFKKRFLSIFFDVNYNFFIIFMWKILKNNKKLIKMNLLIQGDTKVLEHLNFLEKSQIFFLPERVY